MATIRFTTGRPRGAATVLVDLQQHPAALDRVSAPAPPDDLLRRQHELIAELHEFLATGVSGDVVATSRPQVDQLLDGLVGLQGPDLERLVRGLARRDVVEAITDLSGGGRFGGLIVQAERARGLRRLEDVIDTDGCSVEDLRAVLLRQAWMFGGRYRSLPPDMSAADIDERIPVLLTRTDGAFHVVEVAQLNVPDLVVESNDLYTAGPTVTTAVGRAITQLEIVDQLAEQLRDMWPEYLATRRARATVVVGHSRFFPSATPSVIREALRTYSSHLTGIDVITYDELVEVAKRVTASDLPEPSPDQSV